MGWIQSLGTAFGIGRATDPIEPVEIIGNVPGVMGIGLDEVLDSDPSSFQAGLFRQTLPPERGMDELLELYSHAPWLRAVSHKVAAGVGSVEWTLFAKRAAPESERSFTIDKRLRRAKTIVQRRRIMRELAESGDLLQVDDHPMLDLLENPNPVHSGADMFHCGQVHVDVVGETFLVIEGDNRMQIPRRLWVAPPTWLNELPTIDREHYEFTTPDGRRHRFPASAVIHHKDTDPADPYGHGSGIGRSAADELMIDEQAAKHVGGWFTNKGMPDMLVSLKGARKEALERAKREWSNAVQGFRKAYRTHWTGGEIKVERLDTAFKDMALVEIREFARDLIISLWGVPPEKLGIIENSNRATIDAADFIFAKDVIEPRLEKWRQTLQANLVPFYDDRFVLDFVSPVEEDRAFQLTVMQAYPAAFRVNEVREFAGQEPLDGETGRGFLAPAGWTYTRNLEDLKAPVPTDAAGTFPFLSRANKPCDCEHKRSAEPGVRSSPGCRTSGESVDECVARKIPELRAEGMDEEQAIAVAHSLCENVCTDDDSEQLALRPRVVRVLTSADIRGIVSEILAAELGQFVEPVVEQLVAEFGRETAAAIGGDIVFDVDATEVRNHVAAFVEDRIDKLVNETTRQNLLIALSETVADGGTDEDVVQTVRAVFDDARVVRSELIAETEARRSSQFASTEAMKQSGVPLVREWVTALDGRARPEHVDLDGQQRQLGEPFVVPRGKYSGARALFPGSFGIPALDARCRCVVVPVLLDEGAEFDALPLELRRLIASARVSGLIACASMTKEERAAVWRQLDKRLLGFDDMMREALQRGFDAQLERVLAELQRRL